MAENIESANTSARKFLITILVFIGLVVTIGGITRLTRSGLSIADWKVVTGIVPPLSTEAWQAEFNQYKTTVEYKKLRSGMTLDEFKFIFFWEYLHRIVARIIGLLALGFTFLYFRKIPARLRWHTIFIPAMVILQGTIGYLMVRSGYKDIPHVSHFMLAIHLGLAFITAMSVLHLYFNLLPPVSRLHNLARLGKDRKKVIAVFIVLSLQILYGAFVAGKRAGLIFNEWPLMGGNYVPAGLMSLPGIFENLLANSVMLQFIHRNLAIVLTLMIFFSAVQSWRNQASREIKTFWAAFSSLILVQFILGVLTLIYVVPTTLGVIHQTTAYFLILLGYTGLYFAVIHREKEI